MGTRTHNLCFEQKYEKYQNFYLKIFGVFFVVKFSVYLNGRVFVMNAFFHFQKHRNYTLWSCQKVCEAITFLLDNIYIKFGTKLFRQIVSIPMGTNCVPLAANLFLFCYEKNFIMSLSEEKQSEVIEAFSSTSRHLDDLLNTVIDNNYFDGLISQITLQNFSWIKQTLLKLKPRFFYLHLPILD